MMIELAAGLALLAGSPAEGKTLRVPGDFPSIQAALDAARPGDTVLVAAGTYRERVRIGPAVTLRSEGDDTPGEAGLRRAERTVLDGGGEAGDAPGATLAEGSVLDGFSVTRVGLYDDAEWTRHHATRGEEQKHGDIGHFGVPGIGATGVDCTITRNLVHHNGGTGIAVRGAEGRPGSPHVERNACWRNMGGGIGALDGTAAVIRGNRCTENFLAGIGHHAASPLVTDNVCSGNVRAGIGVSEGSSPVVRRNRCTGNRRAGIGIRTGRATRPVVEDNECAENGMAGIGCEEEAAPVLRGNRCLRNTLAGIGVRSGATPILEGNVCEENRRAGIGIEGGSRAVLVGNECRRNALAGIGVRGASFAVLVRNLCVANGAVPVGVIEGSEAVQHGNRTTEEAPKRDP